jgi:hypothetical protein
LESLTVMTATPSVISKVIFSNDPIASYSVKDFLSLCCQPIYYPCLVRFTL